MGLVGLVSVMVSNSESDIDNVHLSVTACTISPQETLTCLLGQWEPRPTAAWSEGKRRDSHRPAWNQTQLKERTNTFTRDMDTAIDVIYRLDGRLGKRPPRNREIRDRSQSTPIHLL